MTENLFGEPAGRPESAWFTAHCDGGARGNPGPAGFGAVIENPEGQVVARLSEFLGIQTNNFAEYSGLLAVLSWAIENRARHLRVVSDSELMVKQMKGQYKVSSPGLRPLWEEARKRAARLERFEIGHTLRGGNKEADRLANEAMDRGMQGSGIRGQGSESAGAGGGSGVRANAYERPPRPPEPRQSEQVLEGYVKGGVVHLLEGELPDGVFVKVIRK